jgi:hypothetical protein
MAGDELKKGANFSRSGAGMIIDGQKGLRPERWRNSGRTKRRPAILLGRQDSNLRMSAPKADALPLGDAPSFWKNRSVNGSNYTDK